MTRLISLPSFIIVLAVSLILSLEVEVLARSNKAMDRPAQRMDQKVLDRTSDRIEQRALDQLEQKGFENSVVNRKALSLVRKIKNSKAGSLKHTRYQRKLAKSYGLALFEYAGREVLVRTSEIIAYNISDQGTALKRKLNLKKIRAYQLSELGINVEILSVESKSGLLSVLSQLKKLDPKTDYDLNIIYTTSGSEIQASSLLEVDDHKGNGMSQGFSLGLIDTGINENHPSLKHANTIQKNFGRGESIMARNHGTAVSSIAARHGRVNLFVADVFSDPFGFSDSESIIKALNWLAQREIAVLNISLTGPDNPLLKFAIAKLNNNGHIIVSSVGNKGPKGPAQFPAAYSEVIAVTAVDVNNNIYKNANHGSYVDIAAPGVGITAATLKKNKSYSGTSFATPFVSAAIALNYFDTDLIKANQTKQELFSGLIDLGEEGFDPTFGHGLLKVKKDLISME